jgi:AraC-like DNA-binding protein
LAKPGFKVTPRIQILLKDIGIRPENVLRRAGLSDGLFNQSTATLSTNEWFEFWRGLEAEARNPLLPLMIGQAISFETFDPALFAAMCSPNLNTALARIGLYKKLYAPVEIQLTLCDEGTLLEFRWLDSPVPPPDVAIFTELVLFVQLARLATREKIRPNKVLSPVLPEQDEPYAGYFGVRIRRGTHPALLFSANDVQRPFLTANHDFWNFFEPELRRQLTELDNSATASDRTHAALLRLLPAGDSSMESLCGKLGMSKRTLQRRLRENGETYQAVLNRTRSRLASHYLKNPDLSGAEISFLLGFKDPNSFFRAFRSWTGKTPRQLRDFPAT